MRKVLSAFINCCQRPVTFFILIILASWLHFAVGSDYQPRLADNPENNLAIKTIPQADQQVELMPTNYPKAKIAIYDPLATHLEQTLKDNQHYLPTPQDIGKLNPQNDKSLYFYKITYQAPKIQ